MKTAFKTYYQRFRSWVDQNKTDAIIAVLVTSFLSVVGIAIVMLVSVANYNRREEAQVQAAADRQKLLEFSKQQKEFIDNAAKLDNLSK